MTTPEKHWVYWVCVGKWKCWETGDFGVPNPGDWYSDCGDWRIW